MQVEGSNPMPPLYTHIFTLKENKRRYDKQVWQFMPTKIGTTTLFK